MARDLSGMKKNPYKKKKKPKARYRTTENYDFLQYIRLVFKYATENYELTRPELEVLLYLYPKGTFTKTRYREYQKTVSMYQIKAFRDFVKEGWIRMWAPAKKGSVTKYCLTQKSRVLCSRLHKMCTGELDIPTSPRSNSLNKKKKRIHQYYLDEMIRMNSDKDTTSE